MQYFQYNTLLNNLEQVPILRVPLHLGQLSHIPGILPILAITVQVPDMPTKPLLLGSTSTQIACGHIIFTPYSNPSIAATCNKPSPRIATDPHLTGLNQHDLHLLVLLARCPWVWIYSDLQAGWTRQNSVLARRVELVLD
jgi:hypothetical protein